ncbi:MAG: hypothetical protein ABSE80_07845 [Halobacteriota archaeon]|jgi:hypothetical protein
MQREWPPYQLEVLSTIQNITKRMATNSLIIKGWTVVVVGIILLLSSTEYQALIAVFALLVFWYLDAYFLQQKKMYRALYKEIVENKLNIGDDFFDIRTARYEAGIEVPRPNKLMRSKTLLIFYGSILTLTFASVGILFALSHGG